MKKYFAAVVMVMVMMVAFAVPVYADKVSTGHSSTATLDKSHHNDNSTNKKNHGTIIQDSLVVKDNNLATKGGTVVDGNKNIVGNKTKIIVKDNNVATKGGTIIDIDGCNEGAVVGGDIKNVNVNKVDNTDVNVNKNIGNVRNVGNVRNSGNSEQDQQQKQQQGQFQTAHNEGVNQETTVEGDTNTQETTVEGDTLTQTVEGNTQSQINEGNTQEVNIENPDEIKINSQMSPMAGQQVDTLGYYGETLEDHKYQDEILEFLLAAEGPKPFKVREHGFFTRKSSHSASKDLSVKEYAETTTVYVFRDMIDLEANIKNYSIVGYADTFSKGKASLMDCFDQAVIDSGEMGGNIVVILDVDYINALKSTTTGLGGSGATGIMKGANQSSVFGAALGYASSKATPETDPFIHGMILYSPELPAEKVPEKAEPVDRFANE